MKLITAGRDQPEVRQLPAWNDHGWKREGKVQLFLLLSFLYNHEFGISAADNGYTVDGSDPVAGQKRETMKG
jgi:hypothetical protein